MGAMHSRTLGKGDLILRFAVVLSSGRFQRRTVESPEPDARSPSLGCQEQQNTSASWPVRISTSADEIACANLVGPCLLICLYSPVLLSSLWTEF